MQEDIRGIPDGRGRRRAFEVLPLGRGGAAPRGPPSSCTGGISTTGCTCRTPRSPVGGKPRSPVGGTRVSPGVTLPDHNRSHTARSPSMGRIGCTGLAGHRTAVGSARSPRFHRSHHSIDPQLPSPVAKYPPPVIKPAIRCERQDVAMTRGLRRHRLVATVPFSPWIMAMQINGRSRVPGALAPAHETPSNTRNVRTHAPSTLWKTCRSALRTSPGGTEHPHPVRVRGTRRPFPSCDAV